MHPIEIYTEGGLSMRARMQLVRHGAQAEKGTDDERNIEG
jgi:hypothetical protein